MKASHLPELSKRADHTYLYPKFGGCPLVPTVTAPLHPKVSEFGQTQYQGRISTYFVVTSPTPYRGKNKQYTCNAPFVTKTADIAGFRASEGGNLYATASPGATNIPWVNSDHVYELSNIKNFFASLLPNNDGLCRDFNSWVNGRGHLQRVLNNLPGRSNPDFAALDQDVNKAKGMELYSWSLIIQRLTKHR